MYSGSRIYIVKDVLSKYELYIRVAHGGNGTVDVGLPIDKANMWRDRYNAGDEMGTEELRNELVAVKFPFGNSDAKRAIVNEVNILKFIDQRLTPKTPQKVNEEMSSVARKESQRQTSSNGKQSVESSTAAQSFQSAISEPEMKLRYASLMDHDKTHKNVDEVHWFVAPWISGINLASFTEPLWVASPQDLPRPTDEAFRSFAPIELICHLFLQLGESINALHHMGIRHGDIKFDNIMVKYHREASWQDDVPNCFPDGYLVDFGSAMKVPRESDGNVDLKRPEFRTDRARFCEVIYDLTEAHKWCHFREEWQGDNVGLKLSKQSEQSKAVAGEQPESLRLDQSPGVKRQPITSPRTTFGESSKITPNMPKSQSGPRDLPPKSQTPALARRARTRVTTSRSSSVQSRSSKDTSSASAKEQASTAPAKQFGKLSAASSTLASSSGSGGFTGEDVGLPPGYNHPLRPCKSHPKRWKEFTKAMQDGSRTNKDWTIAELIAFPPKSRLPSEPSSPSKLLQFGEMANKWRNSASQDQRRIISRVFQEAEAAEAEGTGTGFRGSHLVASILKHDEKNILSTFLENDQNAIGPLG